MKGKQIRDIRKYLGLTQVEFAKAMTVSFATVNRWEGNRCKPLPDRLARLKEMKGKQFQSRSVVDQVTVNHPVASSILASGAIF